MRILSYWLCFALWVALSFGCATDRPTKDSDTATTSTSLDGSGKPSPTVQSRDVTPLRQPSQASDAGMPGARSDVSDLSSDDTSKPGQTGTDHKTNKAVNLLSAKNGGAMVMASGQSWQALMLGKDKQYTVHPKDHVVFAFRQHQAATIDTIAVQFPRNDKSNLKDFEVAISNQSAKGPYESVGTFHAKNDTSSQQFALRPVTAKYLKLIFLSPQDNGHQILVYNFKAFGSLEKPAKK